MYLTSLLDAVVVYHVTTRLDDGQLDIALHLEHLAIRLYEGGLQNLTATTKPPPEIAAISTSKQ